VQDVSERENSARQIANNEARWNQALEGAQIGVFDINLITKQSIVSDSWRKLMEVPLDATDLDTQNLFNSRIHPEDLEVLKAADQQCIDGLSSRSIAEYRMRFDDGSTRWMKSDAIVAERDSDGVALRLLGAQTDVTALREAENALNASRKRFELVLEQAPVGMGLFDKNGNIKGVNSALSQMTGYSEKEMLSGLRFRDLVSHEDFINLADGVKELQSKNRSSLQGEYQIVPKSGPTIWGLISVAWTFDAAENDDIFIVQVMDVNDKKNIEKIKSEFVATVSHELRTPLTSIKGALGLIRASMLDSMPKGGERLLDIAIGNTDRLSDLVNDILDLEKISSGEVEFDIKPTCIAQLLKDGVEQMLPFAAQHKTEFVLEVPDVEVKTQVDARRAQQLIVNLLSNACKYSYSNTKVQVHLEQIDGQALVCIINDGPTISDEFKARIFNPFSQGDASDTRAKGGTGLGLNISKQIVERMDGQIGFTSTPASPTVFWFTMPLTEQAKGTKTAEDGAFRGMTTPRVLHLEDDKDLAEIVGRGLGYKAKITSVCTLSEARNELRVNTFDVVLIDWELPDGNGRELLDEVALLQPNACIVALSASESKVKDQRIDMEIVKSRTGLDEVIAKVERFYKTG
jgi:PAS domain S-box-containing protein